MAEMKSVRRSVSLPQNIDRQIEMIAGKRRLSSNRVLVELVELGLEARKQKEKAFFDVAEASAPPTTPKGLQRLGDQMGQLIFGE